jgi:hypothetical protein
MESKALVKSSLSASVGALHLKKHCTTSEAQSFPRCYTKFSGMLLPAMNPDWSGSMTFTI